MMQTFKNLKELFAYFKEERTAWEYLEKQLWDNKPVCPHCGSTVAYRSAKNYKVFHCGNKKGCNKKFTVTTGTVYENTKLPIATWLGAIWLFGNHKKGVSACQMARDLSITQKSAWFLLHRIREMVKDANEINLDKIVSVDETFVKGAAINRTKKQRRLIAEGKREDKPSVVLGIVEKNGNAVMKVIPNNEAYMMEAVMDKHIDKTGTILVTDGLNAYQAIGKDYKEHIVINHAEGEYVKNGYSTNNAEGVFSWFKRTLDGTYHYVTPYHLQRYCDMFAFRFATRKMKDTERFDIATQKGKSRLKYKDLIQSKGKKNEIPL
jgi:transposase-like protein